MLVYSGTLRPEGLLVSSAPHNAALYTSGYELQNTLSNSEQALHIYLISFMLFSAGQGLLPFFIGGILHIDFSPQYKITKYNKMTKFAFSDPSGTLENKELCRGMPSAQVQSQPERAFQKNNRRGLYFSLNTQNSSRVW